MNEREFELQLDPDKALLDFIDTFNLSIADRNLLKQESLKSPVREELNLIWHVLEMHAAEDEALLSLKALAHRLRTQ